MSDDNQLKKDVLAELSWEPSVSSAHIGVTANAGIVTLSGHVEGFAGKYAAESAAGRVKGVKAVVEEIEVRLPSHIKRGDDEIAAAALNQLDWDVTVPKDAIKVKVEKGWITLSGTVDWHYEKNAAARDVNGLRGVVGVTDLIKIKPHVDVTNIGEGIRHALHRSWFFDSDDILVTADGGKIHLTGNVNSWHERNVAADTAWAAPGATSVQNDLIVI